MKKIITILMALSFCTAVSAQENISTKSERIAAAWEKTKDSTVELYEKIKDNKYAKYGILGTGAALTIVGTGFGLKRGFSKKNNTED